MTPTSDGRPVALAAWGPRLFMALAASGAGTFWMPAFAQDGMRPVPRFSGTSIRDARPESQKASSAANLQWRVSREVAATESSIPPTAVISPAPHAAQASVALASSSRSSVSAVRQAKFQDSPSPADDEAGLQLPPGLQNAPAPTEPSKPLPDFFSDPFGEDLPAPEPAPQQAAPSLQMPPVTNELRSPAPLEEPVEAPEMPAVPLQRESVAPNPFDDTRSGSSRRTDDRELEDFDMPLRPEDRPSAPSRRPYAFDEELTRPAEFSCDEFRKGIAEDDIQKVSLDISPPFRPDVIELDEFQKLKTKFDEAQEIRDWQSIEGRKLGRGRLRDLAYEKIVIETEHGTIEELPLNRVSEADLAYLSKNWGLPQECLIEQVAYQPRSWQHSKVTWKASNLCHKPLYFEEVNLERYGHTAGPFAQPVISTAHFFANIAVLPYKMGVHAPSECQYTLGYYRPGNCAPWIIPPVPISVRGGLYQAAAMTGAFWLIP
ncbi:MAG: hypothetical protein ACO1RT_13930 [Planctomycetaceae bacterium]